MAQVKVSGGFGKRREKRNGGNGGLPAKNGFSAKREKFPTPHTHAHTESRVRGAKQMLVNISAAVIPLP